jgi:sorting nexin-14
MSTFVSVLQEPVENIVKLRTTLPLFQAYEYAYSLLENSLFPLFHESDDVSNVIRIITIY